MQRLTARLNATNSSSAIAAVALATATCCTALGGKELTSDKDAHNDVELIRQHENNDGGGGAIQFPNLKPNLKETSSFARQQTSKRQQSPVDSVASQKPMILASSPMSQVQSNSQTGHINENQNIPEQNILECDYVIIGHGKAGQSAVRTIKRLDPTADIVVIDPNNSQNTAQHSNMPKQRQNLFNKKASSMINYLPTRASYIDHSQKLIHIHPVATSPSPSAQNSTTVSNNIHAIQYRKSALVATGSRGAPPPDSCIRQDAWSRILELRSTSLPPIHPSTKPIPVLDPPTVRSLSIMAASQGATVAIMGSGFEALELAAYCARVSAQASGTQNNNKNSDAKKVLLLFGSSGPMSNFIPRYLSAAVTKRLRQFGIDVEDRAMTRYISMDTPMTSNASAVKPPQLELYTVKSYDNLDSSRILADLLVLAPNVDCLNGTAVVPTASTSSPSSSNSHGNHQPWSSLISPPMLTCYLDDGRIATNSEFHAASSLYAAGSVAKYPDARTGRAVVAGGRNAHSELAGEVAATNMVGDSTIALQSQSFGSSTTSNLRDLIPVWRSDMIPYLPAGDEHGNQSNRQMQPEAHNDSTTLALYSMGIHALCVGRCDSEAMATHGFWWTNTSRSNTSVQSNESKYGNYVDRNRNGTSSDSSRSSLKSIGPNAFMRRATRKTTTLSNKSKAGGGRGSLPVYGSGVVFYLDRSGNIEGVMLWGLPYSENSKDVHSDINNELVERMKDIIRSNGGAAIRDHSEKILSENSGANIDVDLLSYLHLVEESKHLASMALSGASSDPSPTEVNRSHMKRVSVLGRPLHRYTPTKPVELTNLGKMHRKDELGHLTEEDDLFYSTKSSNTTVEESGRPPSLKRIYPMQSGMGLAGMSEYHELEKELKQRQLQMERSRPPKEEPLWLRQGDEQRFVNRRELLADSFHRNIQLGRFKDGSDAVKQAPVPKVYSDAKEKWSSWVDDGDENDASE